MKILNLLFVFFLFTFTTSLFAQRSAQKYIERHKEIAIRHSKETGIPASIILGVAMHESGNGTSKVARLLNNHFGIKGSNNLKGRRSAYKGYSSASASYLHFISILKKKKQYKKLKHVDFRDYKTWAYTIHRGGYAASKTWAIQVIRTIQKYRLWELDRPATSVASTPIH